MKTFSRFWMVGAVCLGAVVVFGLLTISGGGVAREVDAVSVDQFLVNKKAMYEALNERLRVPPEGMMMGEAYRNEALAPKLASVPSDSYVRIAAKGRYDSIAHTEFVIDLSGSSLPMSSLNERQDIARFIVNYYYEPLLLQGFERNGNGGTIGRTAMVSERWNRRFDPTLEVSTRVMVAPESKEAVVTMEIRERLAK